MPRPALELRRVLDPRPAAAARGAPLADAVNLPFEELPARTHELPARDVEVPVQGPPELGGATVAWLLARGRRARYAGPGEAAPAAFTPLGRLWRPHAFLEELLAGRAPGAALDLACGVGREAVFLASRGWRVHAIDHLPDALARARALAAGAAPALAPLAWELRDLERDPPQFAADFDLICGFHYLHRPLLARLAEWLRPGGLVAWETFTPTHRARHARPRSPARVLTAAEAAGLLPGLKVLAAAEAPQGAAHTVRILAARP